MLATPDLVERRIELVEDEAIRKCLGLTYKLAARIGEIVGVRYQSEQSRSSGLTGKSVTVDYFEGKEAYLFTLKTE